MGAGTGRARRLPQVGWGALRVAIAAVWVVNGAWCKVAGQVPRHAQIVARVVGDDVAPSLTVAIGLAELAMAGWWWSGRLGTACAVSQIALVLTMNLIEQAIAADLLLWGRFNLLWACVFCVVVGVVGATRARAALSTTRGSP